MKGATADAANKLDTAKAKVHRKPVAPRHTKVQPTVRKGTTPVRHDRERASRENRQPSNRADDSRSSVKRGIAQAIQGGIRKVVMSMEPFERFMLCLLAFQILVIAAIVFFALNSFSELMGPRLW